MVADAPLDEKPLARAAVLETPPIRPRPAAVAASVPARAPTARGAEPAIAQGDDAAEDDEAPELQAAAFAPTGAASRVEPAPAPAAPISPASAKAPATKDLETPRLGWVKGPDWIAARASGSPRGPRRRRDADAGDKAPGPRGRGASHGGRRSDDRRARSGRSPDPGRGPRRQRAARRLDDPDRRDRRPREGHRPSIRARDRIARSWPRPRPSPKRCAWARARSIAPASPCLIPLRPSRPAAPSNAMDFRVSSPATDALEAAGPAHRP